MSVQRRLQAPALAAIIGILMMAAAGNAQETFPYVDDFESGDPFLANWVDNTGGNYDWTAGVGSNTTQTILSPAGNLSYDDSAYVQVTGVPNSGTVVVEWDTYVNQHTGGNVIHTFAINHAPFIFNPGDRYNGLTPAVFANGNLAAYDNTSWRFLLDSVTNQQVAAPIGEWYHNKVAFDLDARSYLYTVTFGSTVALYDSTVEFPGGVSHNLPGDQASTYLNLNTFSTGDSYYTDNVSITPEPMSMALVGLAGLSLLVCSRRRIA
jgi:hypothetical protein